MTQLARAWLPDGALTPQRVEAALVDIAREWACRWFGDRSCTLVLRNESGKALSNNGDEIRVEGKVAAVTFTGRGKRAALEAALDKRLPDDMNTDDHRLLDVYARSIAEDIVAQFDRDLDTSAPLSGTTITFALLLAGTETCKLICDRQAVVERVRSSISATAANSSALIDRRTALGPMPLEIEGILGSVDLTLDDLENLGVGDVLILDRGLENPIPIRLCSSHMQLGRGALGNRNGHPTLSF